MIFEIKLTTAAIQARIVYTDSIVLYRTVWSQTVTLMFFHHTGRERLIRTRLIRSST